MDQGYNRKATLDTAVVEAKKGLVWHPGGEAIKYTNVFASVFGKGRFSWCGAFEAWCMINSGSAPAGTMRAIHSKAPPGNEHYTFALVEYWQQWAMANGIYHHAHDGKGYVPQPGDQIIFDWEGIKSDSGWDDHIGMVVSADPVTKMVHTAEGNTGNATALKVRDPKLINGYIHIPDGFLI